MTTSQHFCCSRYLPTTDVICVSVPSSALTSASAPMVLWCTSWRTPISRRLEPVTSCAVLCASCTKQVSRHWPTSCVEADSRSSCQRSLELYYRVQNTPPLPISWLRKVRSISSRRVSPRDILYTSRYPTWWLLLRLRDKTLHARLSLVTNEWYR